MTPAGYLTDPAFVAQELAVSPITTRRGSEGTEANPKAVPV